MKSMKKNTPDFVLTSLSFKPSKDKKQGQQASTYESHRSSIAKFDYCLPPEDSSTGGEQGIHFKVF